MPETVLDKAPDTLADAGQKFMDETRYNRMRQSDQRRGLPQPALELPVDPAFPLIELPAPEALNVPPIDLRAAIEGRRSLRTYGAEPLTLEEVAWLLWCSQGVQRVLSDRTMRTVPSGGARHAFDTHLLVNRVDGLAPGLYRYIAIEHKLALVSEDRGLAGRLVKAALDQDFLAGSAVTLIWVAAAYRMTWRYQARGYRYLMMDAGHACQNLLLAAEAIGCGGCPVAAFDDERVNETLGLDGKEQFVLYMAPVGKKK